jgi:hypothetical protein
MKELLLKYKFEMIEVNGFRLIVSEKIDFICSLRLNGTWALIRYAYGAEEEEPFRTEWHVKDAELMEKILQKNELKK